jgi:condensin complex subunit 2
MSVGGSHHRRRSSIFLRRTSLGGSSVASAGTLGTIGGPAGAGGAVPSQENLLALYKKTLRMNAENRINTANSWNLNLIDHIDKFVHEDNDAVEGGDGYHRGMSRRHSIMVEEDGNNQEDGRRVNFTKASCTLDASVKVECFLLWTLFV